MPTLEKAPIRDLIYCTDDYVWSFQTDFNPASHGTFDPTLIYTGTGTPIWRFENGEILSGAAISTTGTTQGLNGTVQTVIVEIPDITGLTGIDFNTDRIFGTIAFNSDFSSLSSIRLESNPTLTAITGLSNSVPWSQLWAFSCNLTGTLSLSGLTQLGGDIRLNSNSGLTAINFPVSASPTPLSYLAVNNCNLTSLNISSFTTTSGAIIFAQFNSNLTTFTRAATMSVLTISLASCRLSTFSMTGITWTGAGTFNVSNQATGVFTGITGTATGTLATFGHDQATGVGTGTLNASYFNWSGPTSTFQLEGSTYSLVNHGSQTGTVRTYKFNGSVNATYWVLPFTLNNLAINFNFASCPGMSVTNVNDWFIQLDSKLIAGNGTITANLSTPAASGAGVTAANSLVSKGFTVVRT